MVAYDERMPSSLIEEFQPLGNSSNSAPSTPQLASTSDAFQFFPSISLTDTGGERTILNQQRDEQHNDDLSRLHSSAFSDLRKSINEAGEGFVRRMREFEAHRNAGRAFASNINSPSGSPNKSTPRYRRGRKRPSAASPYQPFQDYPSISGINGVNEDPGEESDVEIHSSCIPTLENCLSPSKKRAVSLCSSGNRAVTSNTFAYPTPFRRTLQNRERSSSSCGSSSSEEEDEDDIVVQSAFEDVQQRNTPRFRSHAMQFSPPSLSFSFSSASNNSSRMSLPLGVPSPVSYSIVTHSPSSSPSQQSAFPGHEANEPRASLNYSKCTDRAVAALSLALANGAGSVSDYEPLREAQSALGMDDSETGSMWD